jgi:hypothetical protein
MYANDILGMHIRLMLLIQVESGSNLSQTHKHIESSVVADRPLPNLAAGSHEVSSIYQQNGACILLHAHVGDGTFLLTSASTQTAIRVGMLRSEVVSALKS